MDGLMAYTNQFAIVRFLAVAYNILYATGYFYRSRNSWEVSRWWHTCILYATAVDVAVAYNISVRHGCDGSTRPHHGSVCRWRALFLYATTMAVAVAYNISIRLCYVAVAYKNFCTPRNTIPPIAIFLVVPVAPEILLELQIRVESQIFKTST
jgi:hypothetical protein